LAKNYSAGVEMSIEREELLKEVKVVNGVSCEGVRFDPEIFKEDLTENQDLEVMHRLFDYSADNTIDYAIPEEIRIGHGFGAPVHKNSESPYSLERYEDGLYVTKKGERLYKVYFAETPKFYRKNTSDGVNMKTIAAGKALQYGEGIVSVCYSNECALIDKGMDCLFCNINATKRRFGEKEGYQWKNPKQIGETVKAAYDEGYDHFNITGGFIPERRELEYYLDVAEAIQDATGLEDFNGTAVIGAPTDLNAIERYKEAGYRTLAIHPEVWGEDYFNVMCPGKAAVGGGFNNYLKAIDYALEVFGKGRVRTQFVAGLQPKEQVIDGLEYLASRGAVALCLAWVPNIGSAFEGHRSPNEDWHWDLQLKNYEILKKNGVTLEQLYDIIPNRRVMLDLYRIDAGKEVLFEDKRKQK
jgi:hypothetical protein